MNYYYFVWYFGYINVIRPFLFASISEVHENVQVNECYADEDDGDMYLVAVVSDISQILGSGCIGYNLNIW